MGEWRYASYIQKGLSHLADGTECQDNICVVDTEEYLVAALADGLGSLKYSQIASDIATKSVCKAFESLDCAGEEISGHLLRYVVSEIQQEADSRGVQLKELDCTLVFVCIYKNEPKMIVGRLGDSAICIFEESKAVAWNDGNKSANGTSAILDRDAINNFHVKVLNSQEHKITGFILSSDGLENIIYMKGSKNVNKSAEDYFNTLVTSSNPELEIKEQINKIVQVPDSPFDDDISIIVIGCNDEPISLPEDATWLCKCGCRNPLYATYCISCNSDFAHLYENIKFREHGGKAAFFRNINKFPEKEKSILGIKAEPVPIKRKEIDVFIPSRENAEDDKNISHRQKESINIDEKVSVSKCEGTSVEKEIACSSHNYEQPEMHQKTEKRNPFFLESEKKTQHSMSRFEREYDDTIGEVKPINISVYNNEDVDNVDIHRHNEKSNHNHRKKKVKKKKVNRYVVLLAISFLAGVTLGIMLTCSFFVGYFW